MTVLLCLCITTPLHYPTKPAQSILLVNSSYSLAACRDTRYLCELAMLDATVCRQLIRTAAMRCAIHFHPNKRCLVTQSNGILAGPRGSLWLASSLLCRLLVNPCYSLVATIINLPCIELHESVLVALPMAVECPAAGRPPAVHGMLLAQAVSDVGTLPERDWEVSAGAQYRLLATVAVQHGVVTGLLCGLVADVLAVSLALLAVHHSLGLCTSPGAVRQAVVAALTVLAFDAGCCRCHYTQQS